MRKILTGVMAVLLAVPLSHPLHAEKQFPEASRESELPLSPQDEELIAQLETILDETVRDSLNEQYAELNASFHKQSEQLSRSCSFWRKAAMTEGLVILGAVLLRVVYLRK